MSHYLVIHTPRAGEEEDSLPPTELSALAAQHGNHDSRPRWIKAWSPDLHDDRIFSLWEAVNAEEILTTIHTYGFLDHMDARPINVREWGPADVIAAGAD